MSHRILQETKNPSLNLAWNSHLNSKVFGDTFPMVNMLFFLCKHNTFLKLVHSFSDADKIVVHKKKETEVIHTEIPDLTMKKLLDHLENKGPNSTFDLEAVKLLKIDQLGDLIMEKKAAGKDASNDQELREMIEKMERLKQTRLEAKRYGNQPYLTLDLTLDSPLGKNGQERLQQREHIRTQIPANIDLENIALEDAVNLLEILDLDNISSFNTFEN